MNRWVQKAASISGISLQNASNRGARFTVIISDYWFEGVQATVLYSLPARNPKHIDPHARGQSQRKIDKQLLPNYWDDLMSGWDHQQWKCLLSFPYLTQQFVLISAIMLAATHIAL